MGASVDDLLRVSKTHYRHYYCSLNVIFQTRHRGRHGRRMIMCLLRNPVGICRLLLLAATVIHQIPEGDLCPEIQFEGHRLYGKYAGVILNW